MPAGTPTRVFALRVMLVMSLVAWSAFAQDTPIPTKTPPPTIDPTLLTPLPTLTPTPSETPSLTPPPTLTETPTVAVTESPTATATLAAIDEALLTPIAETPVVQNTATPAYPPVPLAPLPSNVQPPPPVGEPSAPDGLLDSFNDPRTVVTSLYAVVAAADVDQLQQIVFDAASLDACTDGYAIYLLAETYNFNQTIRFYDRCWIIFYGRGVGQTILQRAVGAPSGMSSLFWIENGSRTDFHHVTMRGGSTSDGGAIRVYGQAEYTSGIPSQLLVADSEFTGNVASGFGGAVWNNAGDVQVLRTDFLNNQALTGSAYYTFGYISGASSYLPRTRMNCARFEDNVATQFSGALAAYSFGYSSYVLDSTFINNRVQSNDVWDESLIHIHSYAYQYPNTIADPLLDATENYWGHSGLPTGWEIAYDTYNVINPNVNVDPIASSTPDCTKTDPYPLPGDYCPAGGGESFGALQDECPTPTPTATAPSTIQGLIAELESYGISTYEQGVGSGVSDGQTWTVEELQEVLLAVRYAASAFNSYRYNDPSGSNAQAKILFASIIQNQANGANLQILRVTNNFQFGSGDLCDGSANVGCTSNNNNAIALYGNFYPDPNLNLDIARAHFTVLHELGHRFDNQSRVSVTYQDSLSGRLDITPQGQSYVIADCDSIATGGIPNGNAIMGRLSPSPGDWARGARGWGDIVGGDPRGHSDFQQNTRSIVPPNDQATEIGEAAADMFLNWVYRRITDDAPVDGACDGPQEIGQWQGFRNLSGDGSYDDTLPGNARYWWMEAQVADIFSQHLNWQ